jgi:hypothetical protein
MNVNTTERDTPQPSAEKPSTDAEPVGLARTRTRSRRRLVTVVVVAGAIAVAVVVALPAVSGIGGGAGHPAESTPPPSNGLPAFPYTPTRDLAGLGEPHLELRETGLSLIYGDVTGAHHLTVEVSQETPAPYDPTVDVRREQTTVLGRDAVLYTTVYDEPDSTLVWQHRPDMWIVVHGAGIAPADLVWFADGLADRPFPARPPFTFERVPAGLVPIEFSPASMGFAHSGVEEPTLAVLLTTQEGWRTYLTDFAELEDDPTQLGRPMRVGHRDGRDFGRLFYDDDVGDFVGPRLLVHLDGGLLLLVMGVESVSFDELVSFAAGTQVTPDAVALERG